MFRALKDKMYLIEQKQDLYKDIKTVIETKKQQILVTLILTVVDYIDLLMLKKIQNNPLLN